MTIRAISAKIVRKTPPVASVLGQIALACALLTAAPFYIYISA